MYVLPLPERAAVSEFLMVIGDRTIHTSFVAVDSSHRTDGSHGVTVHLAVPVPQGVRYDTTVRERREDPSPEE